MQDFRFDKQYITSLGNPIKLLSSNDKGVTDAEQYSMVYCRPLVIDYNETNATFRIPVITIIISFCCVTSTLTPLCNKWLAANSQFSLWLATLFHMDQWNSCFYVLPAYHSNSGTGSQMAADIRKTRTMLAEDTRPQRPLWGRKGIQKMNESKSFK